MAGGYETIDPAALAREAEKRLRELGTEERRDLGETNDNDWRARCFRPARSRDLRG